VRVTEHVEAAYEGDNTPLAAYGGLIAAFGAASGGLFLAAGRRGRLPQRIAFADIALLGLASQRLSRLVAKDRVGAALRAPLTRYQARGRPGELEETPRREGAGLALGQLVLCPFCLSQWIALGMVSGLVFAPRATRTAAAVLAVGSLADVLQEVYANAVPTPGER
jgi:hypothetical protein